MSGFPLARRKWIICMRTMNIKMKGYYDDYNRAVVIYVLVVLLAIPKLFPFASSNSNASIIIVLKWPTLNARNLFYLRFLFPSVNVTYRAGEKWTYQYSSVVPFAIARGKYFENADFLIETGISKEGVNRSETHPFEKGEPRFKCETKRKAYFNTDKRST